MSEKTTAINKDQIQTINLATWQTKLAVSCYICEKAIPVYDINIKAPLFCEECRQRLKEVLYGERIEE